jgi:hypothetical protein
LWKEAERPTLFRPALPQPHAWPAAILGDELDAGGFQGGSSYLNQTKMIEAAKARANPIMRLRKKLPLNSSIAR